MIKSMNDRVNDLQERCATLAKRNQELERTARQALYFFENLELMALYLDVKQELRNTLSNKPTKQDKEDNYVDINSQAR